MKPETVPTPRPQTSALGSNLIPFLLGEEPPPGNMTLMEG